MAPKNGKSRSSVTRTTYKIEDVTPAKAAQWLKLSKHNRKIIKARVALYKRQIEEGKWGMTGEPIIFNAKGHLVDGQHRLTACVEAGKTFTTLVVRGVAEGMQNLMGQGAPRSASQVLQMNAMAYYAEYPAAFRMIHKLEFAEKHGVWPGPNSADYTPLTNQEILDLARVDETIPKLVVAVKGSDARSFLKPASAFVGVFYYLHSLNDVRAKKFVEGLIDGSDLDKDSPILKLRNLLIKAASTTIVKRSSSWKAAVTLKAWNLWLAGQTTRTLAIRSDEAWPKTTKRYRPRVRKR